MTSVRFVRSVPCLAILFIPFLNGCASLQVGLGMKIHLAKTPVTTMTAQFSGNPGLAPRCSFSAAARNGSRRNKPCTPASRSASPGSPRTGLRPWGGDTPVPVLAPGTGKTKTGRLWTYVRDDRPSGSMDAPAAWFAYSPNRKGEYPQLHLGGIQGILQADAYAGFNKLFEDGTVQEAPCMAHIRLKFYSPYGSA